MTIKEIASQTAEEAVTSEESAPSIETEQNIETPAEESAESATAEESSASGEKTPSETTEEEGPEPKKEKVVKELIAQRKKRQQAEKEAAYWRGVAEASRGVSKPQDQPPSEPAPLIRPKVEDFEDYDQFEQAKETYLLEKAKREVAAEYEQKNRATTEQTRASKVQEDFEAMIERESESNPDFEDVVKEMGNRIPSVFAGAIMESEKSAELIMHFHNDRKAERELAALFAKSPLSAARRLGAIEHELKTKPKPEPPKKVTGAPKPITTVKADSSAAVITDITDLPIDQYITAMNEKQFGKRR